MKIKINYKFQKWFKFNKYKSLKDIVCLSPPNVIIKSLNTATACPSLAHGFFPLIVFYPPVNGYRNLNIIKKL